MTVPISQQSDAVYRGAITLIETLVSAGFPAMLAGGCVRDRQFNRAPKDFDIATVAQPMQIQKVLEAKGYKTIPTGIEHGTITVVSSCGHFEVTSLREDVNSDGRHAQVAFSKSFAQDSARRDFTVNALFEDRLGHIYDFHDGLCDLKHRKLRFIGDSAQRIREDFLRILRFFRFWARFDFEIDRADLHTISQMKDGLRRVSRERITSELLQILTCKAPGKALMAMQSCGLIPYLLPEGFRAENVGGAEHLMTSLDSMMLADCSYLALSRLAVLLHHHRDTNQQSPQMGSTIVDGDSQNIQKALKSYPLDALIKDFFRLSKPQARIIAALLQLPNKLTDARQQSDFVDILFWLDDVYRQPDCYSAQVQPVLRAYLPEHLQSAVVRLDRIWCDHRHLVRSMPISADLLLATYGTQMPGAKLGEALAYLTKSYRNSDWQDPAQGMRLLTVWLTGQKSNKEETR